MSDEAARIVVAVTIRGPIQRSDLPAISDRICSLLAANRGCRVRCHLDGVRADAVGVEALARLQVVARRNACRVVLCGISRELSELVELLGLSGLLTEDG